MEENNFTKWLIVVVDKCTLQLWQCAKGPGDRGVTRVPYAATDGVRPKFDVGEIHFAEPVGSAREQILYGKKTD